MNHQNKHIYSNREGANGSHRINDHLRVSTIKTAHRRPLNNNTANNNINTTVKVRIKLITNNFGWAVEPKLKWLLRFFDVTKPASICYNKKFRNHENVSLQTTRPSLTGVLISLYYSNIRVLFGGISADKIQRRIQLAEFLRWIFGGQKFVAEFSYWLGVYSWLKEHWRQCKRHPQCDLNVHVCWRLIQIKTKTKEDTKIGNAYICNHSLLH